VKAFRSGTHRAAAPEATVERVGRLMPVLGITRVANVTGLDSVGIPVVMVCRPNSRSLAVSQGKGLTLTAARASGLMEAAEGYHAERITLPLKLASYNELRFTHAVTDPAVLARLSTSAFHGDLRLLWIEGWDAVAGTAVWLPYESVHTDFTLPLPPGSGCFPLTGNGLASGNHRLEAMSHALAEVIERDADALWEIAGPEAWTRTRLDLGSVDDPACCEVLDRLDGAGVSVAAWETTSDLGVAAFRCVILDRSVNPVRPLGPNQGTGCHPSRGVALLRALTEAVQSRLTGIAGSRDDLRRSRYAALQDLDALEVLQAGLAAPGPRRDFRDAPDWEGNTFEEDLLWMLGRLSAAGLHQVLAVDLTRPGLEIPVVRVVVPGLESSPHVPGYLPGLRARTAAGIA
jgi:ribosomal protein S12 methylthiotransferase accessory factor